jgi:hypothetical protein
MRRSQSVERIADKVARLQRQHTLAEGTRQYVAASGTRAVPRSRTEGGSKRQQNQHR